MELSNSITSRLKFQHETIGELILNLDEQQLLKRPQPDKWNIHDNIAHLARYQHVFIERVNKILDTENPSFGSYKADNDPEFINWQNKSTKELIQQISADRQDIIQLINTIPENQSDKKGSHPFFGNLNIVKWTERFLLHEAHHLFTIINLVNL